MSNKNLMLQDAFLNTLRSEHVPVSIYLINGIKLQGEIGSFDSYVIVLEPGKNVNGVTQMVYKHAISTIVPGRQVSFKFDGREVTVGLSPAPPPAPPRS